jgi:hypothetical protein
MREQWRSMWFMEGKKFCVKFGGLVVKLAT